MNDGASGNSDVWYKSFDGSIMQPARLISSNSSTGTCVVKFAPWDCHSRLLTVALSCITAVDISDANDAALFSKEALHYARAARKREREALQQQEREREEATPQEASAEHAALSLAASSDSFASLDAMAPTGQSSSFTFGAAHR